MAFSFSHVSRPDRSAGAPVQPLGEPADGLAEGAGPKLAGDVAGQRWRVTVRHCGLLWLGMANI
jgi:hypothetical protein